MFAYGSKVFGLSHESDLFSLHYLFNLWYLRQTLHDPILGSAKGKSNSIVNAYGFTAVFSCEFVVVSFDNIAVNYCKSDRNHHF